ncbi:MAG: hypothetical protein K2L45_06710 [Muribaculaceae bacterium]|nr:hypothetical protein [Muribaculaceae bacterium]
MNTSNKIQLPNTSKKVSGDPTIKTGTNYTIFDPSARPDKFFKPSLIGAKLLKGRKKIIIWDPHFSPDKDHEFFSFVDQEDAHIEILTTFNNNNGICKSQVETLADNICEVLNKNIETYTLLMQGIKYDEMTDLRSYRIFLWHDRFMILDDDFYLMGTSMSSQLTGNKLFGIYKVEDPTDKDIIGELYQKYSQFSQNKKNGFTLKRE